MNPVHRRLWQSLVTGFTLFSMCLSLVVPVNTRTYAQDLPPVEAPETSSSEDASAPTEPAPTEDAGTASDTTDSSGSDTTAPIVETATETPGTDTIAPPEVTEPPLATPNSTDSADVTPEVTEAVNPVVTEAAEGTAEATDIAVETITPTAPPPADRFADDFQSADDRGWAIAGWAAAAEGDDGNIFLYGGAGASAIAPVTWEHILLTARVRVEQDSTFTLVLHGGYSLTVDAYGNAALVYNDSVVAQSETLVTPEAEATFAPVWRTLGVQKLGGLITAAVDGAVVFAYDASPLAGEAPVTFATDDSSLASVSLDDVVIIRLDPPVPTASDSTPEATPDSTLEATVEATLEATVEATTEATVPAFAGTLILSADFESALDGWTLSDGASVVSETDANQALFLATGTLAPRDVLTLNTLRLDTRVNFAAEDGTLTFTFIGADGAQYPLTLDAAALGVNAWRTLSLTVQADGTALVVVDGGDADPVIISPVAPGAGTFSVSGSSVLIDDVQVYDLAEPLATPTPLSLTETEAAKLDGALVVALNLYLAGDEAGALAAAVDYGAALDENNRAHVIFHPAADVSVETLASLVEAQGGAVDLLGEGTLDARISLAGLLALAGNAEVYAVRLPSGLISTGIAADAGNQTPTSVALLGTEDWYLAGARGAVNNDGVNIALIDTGFGTSSSSLTSPEFTCLTSTGTPNGGFGTGTHGLDMLEVICDFAPEADVTLYQADSASELQTQIAAADDNNRIIVIPLDLGVDFSPGDGTGGGNPTAEGVYDALEAAYNNGVIVIASAGNNGGDRQLHFDYSGSGTGTLTFDGIEKDAEIRVAFDGWGSTGETLNATLSGSGFSSLNQSVTTNGTLAIKPTLSFAIPDTCDGADSDNLCDTQDITLTINSGTASHVQVQILDDTGLVFNVTGGAISNLAADRTLARPADSPYVITVGAVVNNQGQRYPVAGYSALGPVFGAGGTITSLSALNPANVKPEIVSIGNVETVTSPESAGGFVGTSVSAAHIAGMTALMLSNTSNSTMTQRFDVYNQVKTGARVDAVEAYLVTHSVDLWAGNVFASATANGLDFSTGAGIPFLGNPAFNLNAIGSSMLSGACNDITCIYAGGEYDPNAAQDGSLTRPYIHLTQAIAVAQNSATINKIVVLPGEYVSSYAIGTDIDDPLLIRSYDQDTSDDQNDSVFWVNENHQGTNAFELYSETTTMDGFIFNAAAKTVYSTPAPMYIAAGTISNSEFNSFRLPIEVGSLSASTDPNERNAGVQFIGNRFVGFVSEGFDGTGVMRIVDAGNNDAPVLLDLNEFVSNASRDVSAATIEGILAIKTTATGTSNSAVSVRGSKFINNSGDSVVSVQTCSITSTAPDTRCATTALEALEIEIFSTQFLNNQVLGPIVYLAPTPRFRFVNNSLINNYLPTGTKVQTYNGLIYRGQIAGGTTSRFRGFWEIHNNLFYNNQTGSQTFNSVTGLVTGSEGAIVNIARLVVEGCAEIVDSGDPTPSIPISNNWFFASGSATQGNCAGFMVSGGKLPADYDDTTGPNLDYQGDADAYQLLNGNFLVTPAAAIRVAQDSGEAGAVINKGTDVRLSNIFGGGTLANLFDMNGALRVAQASVDIGSLEFTGGVVPPLTSDEPTFNILEDTPNIAFQLQASGGYQPYGFSLVTSALPQFYNANSLTCNRQPARFEAASNRVTYCPPPDFYTDDGDSPNVIPDSIQIGYQVQDILTGEILGDGLDSNLQPDPDERLFVTINIAPVEDLTPSAYTPTLEAPLNEPFTIRLVPRVSFENNFSLNGGAGTQFGADYPFDYTFVDIDNDCGILAVSQSYISDFFNDPEFDGIIPDVEVVPGNIPGCNTFTLKYNITDGNGFSFPINEEPAITYTGVTSLTAVGTYDDSSLEMIYSPRQWTPQYSEPNYNNTLHRTTTQGAETSFTFSGATSFVLNIQGSSSGGHWLLRVTDNSTATTYTLGSGANVLGINGSNSSPTNPAARCYTPRPLRTTALTNVSTTTYPLPYIANNTSSAYTVWCRGFDNSDGVSHTVELINVESGKPLAFDAVQLIDDSDGILLPGMYEVTDPEIADIFRITPTQFRTGWSQVNNSRASGGVVIQGVNFSTTEELEFEFKGTGIAIGTVLQANSPTYEICIARNGQASEQVCQTFDNEPDRLLGTSTSKTVNYLAFRPFFGFENPDDPNGSFDDTYTATIRVNDAAETGRPFLLDSIVVFDTAIPEALPFGTTENDDLARLVYGGVVERSWVFDANNTKASSRTLHSLRSGVTYAGPFAAFSIPRDADTINWFRVASTSSDARFVQICVDRAYFDAPIIDSTVSTLAPTAGCIIRDLRTQPNPLVIRQSDFSNGWEDSLGVNDRHVVEIFSLNNEPFNIDRLQVIDSGAAFSPGFYDQTVLADSAYVGSFSTSNDSKAFGGSVRRSTSTDASIYFEFTGTGFTPYFVGNTSSDAVRICYLPVSEIDTSGTSERVTEVLTGGAAAGTCQTFDNQSSSTKYLFGRSFLGLEDISGDPDNDTYAVAIRRLTDQGQNAGGSRPSGYDGATSPEVRFDGFEIHGSDATTLDAITPDDGRIETSYTNRAAENRFQYLGSGWRSVVNTSGFGGRNYDTTSTISAGVTFLVDDANFITVYRTLKSGFAPLQICSVDTGDGSRVCENLINSTATSNSMAHTFALDNDLTDVVAPHIVSIASLDSGAFQLDSVEALLDLSGGDWSLAPGLYQENDPRLDYSVETGSAAGAPLPSLFQWNTLGSSSYNGGFARQLTTDGGSVSFRFDGTGVTIYTILNSSAGSSSTGYDNGLLTFTLDGTPISNLTYSSYNSSTATGQAYTIAGLEDEEHTLVISVPADSQFERPFIDAVEVVNSEANGVPVGYYDLTGVAPDGAAAFSVQPSGYWAARTGVSGAYLLTRSETNRSGAGLTFTIEDANAITLHYPSSTSNSDKVNVCWQKLSVDNDALTCRLISLTVGSSDTIILDEGTNVVTTDYVPADDYVISISNGKSGRNLYLDAIGIHALDTDNDDLLEQGDALTMGVYQDTHDALLPAFTGTSTANVSESSATDGRVRSVAAGAGMTFNFTGTGFSILVSESTTTAASYALEVDNVAVSPALTRFNNSSSTERLRAITFVGLPDGTHTVELTNTDATLPVLVDRVDVLGDLSDLGWTVDESFTGSLDNTSPSLFSLPYGMFNPSSSSSALNGSQAVGSVVGSMLLFQVNNAADGDSDGDSVSLAFNRITSSSAGAWQVCIEDTGTVLNAAVTTGCTPQVNNVSPSLVQLTPATAGDDSDYYVAFVNTTATSTPFDFVRQVDASAPLTAGFFEAEALGGLNYLDVDEWSFGTTPLSSSGAFNGQVIQTNVLNDGALFTFEGTGFTAYLSQNNQSGNVEVCYRAGEFATLAALDTGSGGTCQTFGNYSSSSVTRSGRSVNGLPFGVYTVSVQHLGRQTGVSYSSSAPVNGVLLLDALEVHGIDWTALDALTVGSRIETSYTNRLSSNRFAYFGPTWTTTSSSSYSGGSYDRTTQMGAGVVFTTTGANSLTIFRETNSNNSFAPLEICAAKFDGTERRCVTNILSNAPTGRIQPISFYMDSDQANPDNANRVVTITMIGRGALNLDAVQTFDLFSTMTAGNVYEEGDGNIQYSLNAPSAGSLANTPQWNMVTSSGFTSGRAMQTFVEGATAVFKFTGAGVEIGTQMATSGGPFDMCFATTAAFSDARCMRFNNNATSTNTNVRRTIYTGQGTWFVRISNDAAAQSTNQTLVLDFVRILTEVTGSAVEPGVYDETASANNIAYLYTAPSDRWVSTSSSSYSFGRYLAAGIASKASSSGAGQIAVLPVFVEANTDTAVVFNTGTALGSGSLNLLVCNGLVTNTAGAPFITTTVTDSSIGEGECAVLNSSSTDTFIGVTLEAGASDSTRYVSLTTLKPGNLRVDGYAVIPDEVLHAGLYDSGLAQINDSAGADALPINLSGTWTLNSKTSSTVGGTVVRGTSSGSAATFQFTGSGFSVVTYLDKTGADFRICYKDVNSSAVFPASTVWTSTIVDPNTDVACRVVTTDTTQDTSIDTSLDSWEETNPDRPTPGKDKSVGRYGFSIYGLDASRTYAVEIRVIDGTNASGSTRPFTTTGSSPDNFKLDAIVVFGPPPPQLGAGFYDSTDARIAYAPADFWTTQTFSSGPTKGAFGRSQQNTVVAGALALIAVDTDAMILYQSIASSYSSWVNFCLADDLAPVGGAICTDFSQRGSTTWFTPIAFLGLGGGDNLVILENLIAGATMNIDAIQILP